ncbi:RHS repeat-associated core domain-containing protein, partial [Ralstonia pseudosolanacearum]
AFTYNLRFPGQVYDAETGKHYNVNRDYDPASGRYVQSDPIGLNGGQWSTYAYVDGNPLTLSDPLGLTPLGETIGSGIGTWGGRVIGGAICSLAEPGGGTAVCAVAGGAVGGRIGRAVGGAVSDACQGGSPNPCDELTKKVRDAKDHMGRTYKAGEAVCRPGMSNFQLSQRANDWLRLAQARAQRDQKCFGGGDFFHQTEQATAWRQVSICQQLMR